MQASRKFLVYLLASLSISISNTSFAECEDGITFTSIRSSATPGGTAANNGRLVASSESFNGSDGTDALFSGIAEIPPSPDIEITTDVNINSGLVQVWAPPLGGFSEAGASLHLDVTEGGSPICSARELLGTNNLAGGFANTRISRDSKTLSCRAGIEPTGPHTIMATVTLHVWSGHGGLGNASARADVTVASLRVGSCCIDALESPEGMVPLFSWFSPRRNDNFITSQPTWAGCNGSFRSPDYRFVRKEGYVFDPSKAQPENTVKFYRWWSGNRMDNWATSQHMTNGDAGLGIDPNYRFSRLEGYLLANPEPRTAPLHSWWSTSREDNWATAQHGGAGLAGGGVSPDYSFVRREGYLRIAP